MMKVVGGLTVFLACLSVTSCGGGDGGSSTIVSTGPTSTGKPTIATLELPLPPHEFHLQGADLIWSDEDRTFALKKISVNGGEIDALTIRTGSFRRVVVQNGNIFWLEYQRLMKLSSNGIVTILSQGAACLMTNGLVVDANAAFWAVRDESGSCKLERVNIVDGTVTTVANNPNGSILSLAADTTHVYWMASVFGQPSVIRRVSKEGGVIQEVAAGFTIITGFPPMVVHGDVIYFSAFDSVQNGQSQYALLKVPVGGGTPIKLAVIGSQPLRGLAVNETNVYWVDGVTVGTMPLNGGSVVTLAEQQNQAVAIAIGGEEAFWLEVVCCTATGGRPSRIKSVPLMGGPVRVVADGFNGGTTLTSEESSLYWTEGESTGTGTGRIARCSFSGGPVTTVVNGLESLSTPFVGDDKFVYVADGNVIKKVPLSGSHSVETLFIAGSFNIEALATDGMRVYWHNHEHLKSISVEGGEATTLAYVPNIEGRIVASRGIVYWAEATPIQTYAIKATDSSGNTTTLAVTSGPVSDVLVDEEYVYFTHHGTSAIRKVPLAGGTISTLFAGGANFGSPSLAQDASHIYWVNNSQVGKVPKSGGDIYLYQTVPDSNWRVAVNDEAVFWTVYEGIKRAIPK